MKNFHYVGVLSFLLGIGALCTAIFQDDIRRMTSPPKEEPTVKELLLEKGKNILKTKILGEEELSRKEDREPNDWVQILIMILGFLSIILAVIYWVKKGNIRISTGAISIALVALAWQYVYVAVGLAILIMILSGLAA